MSERETRDSESDEQAKQSDTPRGISAIEWAVAAVGLLIVAGVIVFLVNEALSDDGKPPSLTFDVIAVEPVSGGYVVQVSALNEGDLTAADVTVTGQLLDGETVVEEREFMLDFVPPHSTRRGGLFFSENPDDWTLVLQPQGYQEP